MSTTTRTADLAAQFEAVNEQVAAAVEGCNDESWATLTEAEGWTVAATAHHIAIIQRAFTGLVGTLVADETFTPTQTMDQINAANARHAEEYAAADRRVTLDVLHASRDDLLAHLRALTDADLERFAGTFGGNEFTVGQVFENIVIGHPRAHLASIQATLTR